MNRPMSRRTTALASLAAAVVLFVAVNLIAGNWFADVRVDLTQEGLYTLSPATRTTLAKIAEPITLRFYYSPQLGREVPSYGVFADRVREMLQQYAAVAKGKIVLQTLDPEPFSSVEDRAVAFGLQGVPLDQNGTPVYFGLAGTNSTDDQATIPFFQTDRERFLEYDLTKLIAGLADPHKTVVGLATQLPLEGDLMAAMQGRPLVPYAVLEQMQQLYDVHTLGVDFATVPSNVDVLMLVHPQKLSDKTLYAIDQFVLKGGRALVFVDPDSETQRRHPSQLNPPGLPNDSNLDKLFAAWGLRLVPKMVAADRANAERVNAGTDTNVQAVDYVGWLTLKTDSLSRDNPITADLSQINVATPGVLEPLPGAKTTFAPLITTSTDSMEIPADKFQAPDPAALLAGFKSDGKKLVIAAQVTGPAATAFPDGPPKSGEQGKAAAADKKDDAPPPAAVKTAVKPIDVVAVADTDILDDRFWVQVQNFFGQRVAVPTASNGDFVTDTIDVLAGGTDLVGLRSRGTAVRPFTLVQNIQRAADTRYQTSEKGLEDKLKDTEQKLKDLRDKGAHQAGAVDAAQNETIENFRAQMLATRRQLRQVQLAEREDIDRLQNWVEFFDIALIPILVAFAALVIGTVRLRRRQRRAATG
ncbi:MAG TPA: Gldg family protein [Stellaceae bacterium]|nr:Gldg family protein [Stellaceae bacterium]